MFRQDRANPGTRVSQWKGRHDTAKGWPGSRVSSWLNGGLFGGAAGPPAWYVGIAHAAVSLPATPIVFTSTADGGTGDFSQYMDLVLIAYIRSQDTGDPYTYISLNNSTSFTSTNKYMQGDGSSVSAGSSVGVAGKAWVWRHPYSTQTANVFGTGICTFFDINSDKYKSMLSQSASDLDGSGYCFMATNTIATTAVVSSIEINDGAGAGWSVGSTFDLFGLKREPA